MACEFRAEKSSWQAVCAEDLQKITMLLGVSGSCTVGGSECAILCHPRYARECVQKHLKDSGNMI